MTTATAPGKIILFGEHAVVYGKPAIAVPVSHVRATATVEAANDGQITLILPDVAERWEIECALPEDGGEKRPGPGIIVSL